MPPVTQGFGNAAYNYRAAAVMPKDSPPAMNRPIESPDLERLIRGAVALADKIRNGIDVNGNEHVEPVAGEGGAVTAYEHAYYMADMVIVPGTNPLPTP